MIRTFILSIYYQSNFLFQINHPHFYIAYMVGAGAQVRVVLPKQFGSCKSSSPATYAPSLLGGTCCAVIFYTGCGSFFLFHSLTYYLVSRARLSRFADRLHTENFYYALPTCASLRHQQKHIRCSMIFTYLPSYHFLPLWLTRSPMMLTLDYATV